MKKILAILMTVVIVLSFAACTKPVENANPTTTQSVTEDKQSFYETFFTKENYKTAGNSATLSSAGAGISIIQDAENVAMFEIKVLENYFRLYQLSDGKQYVNTKLAGEDGTVEDVWGQCESSTEDMLESMDLDTTILDMDFDSITKVEYLESKDGTDVVRVFQKDPEFVEGTVRKEYCIKFVYNDTDCELILTTDIDPEGGESTSYNTDKVAEGFEVIDYTVDYETKQLVHWEDESKNIPFELVSEETITNGKDISYDFSIDAEKKVVTSIAATTDGQQITYTFFNVDSCLEGVEIPSDAEACDEETLAMLMLGVLFSGMTVE